MAEEDNAGEALPWEASSLFLMVDLPLSRSRETVRICGRATFDAGPR